MQDELQTQNPTLDITLYGVNMVGFESAVDTMTAGNDIGLVQDTSAADVTGAWGANYRDVILLDESNHIVGVYNLTANNLSVQANYDTLRDMLVAEASN